MGIAQHTPSPWPGLLSRSLRVHRGGKFRPERFFVRRVTFVRWASLTSCDDSKAFVAFHRGGEETPRSMLKSRFAQAIAALWNAQMATTMIQVMNVSVVLGVQGASCGPQLQRPRASHLGARLVGSKSWLLWSDHHGI